MAEGDPYSEPTLKVPVPCNNYLLIVVSDGTSFAASEIPRAVCSDTVLNRIIDMMEREMRKANEPGRAGSA
jgi:hypothetical protein